MLSIKKSIARQSSLQKKVSVLCRLLTIRSESVIVIGSNEAFSSGGKNSF